MTKEFSAGQNAPLTTNTVRFTATASAPLDVCALVVDKRWRIGSSDDVVFFNQTRTQGVRLDGDCVVVELDTVRPGATVVCGAGSDRAVPISTTLTDADGSVLATFVVTPRHAETALLCWELYRHNNIWKIRALGQGYAGGLAELFTAHGVDLDDEPAPTPAAPALTGTELAPSCELMWRIFEDASRSAAAYVAAHEYAQHRLDEELSAAVADPASRIGPGAESARAQAHRRCNDLVEAAEARHLSDSAALTGELHAVDAVLPASMASWESVAWQRAANPADGVRVGELWAPDRGPLRVPLCVPLPLEQPLWIEDEDTAATAIVTALVLRLLCARPGTRLDLVDPAGALVELSTLAKPMLAGPPIHAIAGVAPKLKGLAEAADLTDLAVSAGTDTGAPEPRVLVLAGVPHGYSGEDLLHVVQLARFAAARHVSIVITGTSDTVVDNPAYRLLHDAAQHLPATGDGHLADPWTKTDWLFVADTAPVDIGMLQRVVAGLVAR
ncbi:TerD family protein [Rhodococcus chondri]|uniref:TerD family protein n=1 Tax=Rhodococcus chondri TaxID=3065941 RepID=A0ABU7JKI8_9NOCA|nr:TerD family protein [Rhodococcus sp. CC-R104]MEE2030558.1 TerD family protein [Rhodococcus sp. CC-R104]